MTRRNRFAGAGLTVPLLAAMSFLPAPLLAQEGPLGRPSAPEAPGAPDRKCVCSWEMEAPRVLRPTMARFHRARLGVELGEPDRVGARTGVRLRSVAEGGPAERAGIRAGDVVLSLDGSDLGEEPIDRLLELLSDVEPGDTVSVGYSREGQDFTARVVTDRTGSFTFFGPDPETFAVTIPRMRASRAGAIAPDVRFHLRGLRGHSLELVRMNEGLGSYFDVSEGVLVASVPEDSRLGLRPGDVIVSVGGRPVEDPAHAHSILASYRPTETISIEIVREGRRTTVTGTKG